MLDSVLPSPSNSRLEPVATSSPELLRRLAASRLAPVALVLLCVAALLPGLFSMPPIDRDEARFAQASRQMFESVALPEAGREAALHGGGLSIPYVQDKPRLNKPPLIYWLQAGSAALWTAGNPLKDAIWMYRIPGVLCVIGSVLLTWMLARAMAGPTVALLAGAGLAVCPVVVLDAHQARADQLLLLTVVATQALLWRMACRGGGLWTALCFWVCIGLGVLAKGPMTPMIAALTAIAWSVCRGEWRWLLRLQPWLGVLIVAAMVGPWVTSVAQRVGWDFYLRTVWDETIGRSVEGKEGHWGPPGFHTLLVFALLWPLSLGLPGAIVEAFGSMRAGEGSWLRRVRAGAARSPDQLFLLAWVLPSWVVFELVSTKLPHYTLPMYPALCILAARWIVAANEAAARKPVGAFLHWTRIWFGIGVVAMLGISVLAITPSWWAEFGWWKTSLRDEAMPRTNWWMLFPIAAMLYILGRAGRELAKMQTVRATLLVIPAVVLAFAVLLGSVAPPALTLSTRLAQHLPAGADAPPVFLQGYAEDSLVFLTRGRAKRSTPSPLPLGAIIVTDRAPVGGELFASFRGFNLAKSRAQTVYVLYPERGGP